MSSAATQQNPGAWTTAQQFWQTEGVRKRLQHGWCSLKAKCLCGKRGGAHAGPQRDRRHRDGSEGCGPGPDLLRDNLGSNDNSFWTSSLFIFISIQVYFSTVKNIIYPDFLKHRDIFLWILALGPRVRDGRFSTCWPRPTWHMLSPTHQEIAKALIVKHFALVSLSQLFAQLDGLLPHLQKEKSGEQSRHSSSCKGHLKVTGSE